MIDVLIPTKDRPHVLALCLQSILYQEGMDLRIVIRDASAVSVMEQRHVRGILELLRERYEVVYLRAMQNHGGVVRARHDMTKHIRSELAIWVDDDVLLAENALAKLTRVYVESKAAFAVPIMLDVDNARQHKDYSRDALPYDAWSALGHSRLYRRVTAAPSSVYTWRGHTMCMMSHGELWRDVVKFDYWTEISQGEDILASVLLCDECGPGIIVPEVECAHLTEPQTQWQWTVATTESLRLYFKKRKVSEDTLRDCDILGSGYKVV